MSPEVFRKRRRVIVFIFAIALILLCVGVVIYRSDQSRRHQQSLLEKQQEEFAKTATADPILKVLPYGSLDYNITPTFERVNNSRELVVVISVILTGADYRESPQAIQNTVDQKEAAALNYIRSKGFDPSKYHIQYSVPAH
jgi:hypothetical protein